MSITSHGDIANSGARNWVKRPPKLENTLPSPPKYQPQETVQQLQISRQLARRHLAVSANQMTIFRASCHIANETSTEGIPELIRKSVKSVVEFVQHELLLSREHGRSSILQRTDGIAGSYHVYNLKNERNLADLSGSIRLMWCARVLMTMPPEEQ